MKHFVYLALIGALLSGCADTPLKEADIEDRALSTASFQADATAKTDAQAKTDVDTTAVAEAEAEAEAVAVEKTPEKKSIAVDPVLTSGLSDADIAAKALAEAKAAKAPAVVTQPVELQEPEAKPLEGSIQLADSTDAQPSQMGGKSDDASPLKYEAQPVLDPTDPQSPLAQRRIMFDFDSSAIRDEYRELLENHAKYLKSESAARLILQGHADERGSREYNLALGQRRSESVFRALNLLGVPESQMEAVSLGEEKPIDEGHDENAWAQNRRAELLYQGE
jgi:peptidoglycan-associated lipoprotein